MKYLLTVSQTDQAQTLLKSLFESDIVEISKITDELTLRAIEAERTKNKLSTKEPQIGKVYKGVVKRIMDFGAFVEIIQGKEGLLHISEISHERIKNIDDILNVGQEIEVKIIDIDTSRGQIKLSLKALL